MEDSQENTEQDKFAILLGKAQSGDSDSYSVFLDLLYQKLKVIVSKKTQNNKEDLIQEIMISVHHARHTYDSSRPFLPWLYSIVNFRLSDQKRAYWRNGRKILHFIENTEDPKHTAVNNLKNEDLTNDLSGALSKLPEKQKTIVTMLKLQGYSIKEISEKLSMSTTAVKVSASRAYNTLRSILTEEKKQL